MSHIEVVDPTRLRDSLQCLRYHYWSNERHIVPKAPRLPLAYGVSVHACLAEHYRGKSAGLALKAFEENWDREVLPYQGEWDEEDPRRNPRRWMEVFTAYRQHYQAEQFKVLYVEAPFFLPLTAEIALGGVIDLVVEYLNQVMIIDHKTTYDIGPKFISTFNPNHQFSSYLLGASELLGKPITTLLVNCIKSDRSELRPEKIFARVPTLRSPVDHQMMKEELIGWWTIVRECRRTGNWPRNDDRCQRWPGGCEYHSLCVEIMADFRRLIPSKALFREHIHDPVAELRQHGFNETI